MSRRSLGHVLEVAVPILLLLSWGVWSSTADNFYFPPLTGILESFWDTWIRERFFTDAIPSLSRIAWGFGIAVVLGVTLGVVLGTTPAVSRAVHPIVEFLRTIPAPAMLPFAIVVFGVGDVMKVFIIALVCVFPVLLNTIDGIRGVDPTFIDTSNTFGVSRSDRLLHVMLPAALPQIFAGMRTSLSLSLIMMVISEMVASSNGIGYSVLQAQREFAISSMWSGIVLLGLLGYALNLLLMLVERRVLRWHRGSHSEVTL